MDSNLIDHLINQAESATQKGDWVHAIEHLKKALEISPHDPGILTGIGKCYLQTGDYPIAAEWFKKVLAIAPSDTDALNNLGVVSMILQQYQTSEEHLKKAVEIDPNNLQAWKNLAVLYLKQENRLQDAAEVLLSIYQVHPEDLEVLLLIAKLYEEGEDFLSAKSFYQQALNQAPQHPQILEAIERVNQRSIRPDPSRIARPEHAKKLAALKNLSKKAAPVSAKIEGNNQPLEKSCLFLGPPIPSSDLRLIIPAQELINQRWIIKTATRLPEEGLSPYQSVLIGNPHMSQELREAAEECIRSGKKLIIDIDRDFFHMPADHPLYSICGPGAPETLQQLQKYLSFASTVTIPNPYLAEKIASYCSRIRVIPYSWGKWNTFWKKPAHPRSTINIGVLDRYTTPAEAELLKPSLARILAEFPQVLLAIGSGIELINVFGSLPDDRKFFVPPSSSEDFPFTLSNIDLLLLPSLMREYDLTASDYPLMEAGVRGIPWIASPLPTYMDWKEGGMFAQSEDDWYFETKTFLLNQENRTILIDSGIKKAATFASDTTISEWIKTI